MCNGDLFSCVRARLKPPRCPPGGLSETPPVSILPQTQLAVPCLRSWFEGILQTDGYAAYDQIGGPRMVHAACWSHARRQFFEAVRLNPRDPVATPIVAQIDQLFAVEAEARRKTLTTAARHILRQETGSTIPGIS